MVYALSTQVWGFSCLCLECLQARSSLAPGFWLGLFLSRPCTFTAGETKAWTRKGLPHRSPEDTHRREEQSTEMAWCTLGREEEGWWEWWVLGVGAQRVAPQHPESKPGRRVHLCFPVLGVTPPKHTPTTACTAMGLDVLHPKKEPLLGFLAGLWVCHHFLVRAECRKRGTCGA